MELHDPQIDAAERAALLFRKDAISVLQSQPEALLIDRRRRQEGIFHTLTEPVRGIRRQITDLLRFFRPVRSARIGPIADCNHQRGLLAGQDLVSVRYLPDLKPHPAGVEAEPLGLKDNPFAVIPAGLAQLLPFRTDHRNVVVCVGEAAVADQAAPERLRLV